jgi:uncharacterized protein
VRAVLDTNIYVSAFALPGSIAEEALQRAVHGRYELVTSTAILAELATVLANKFKWDPGRALEACREILEISTVVRPKKHIRVLADDPDNRILECALAAHADCIVTGDKHLLGLGRFEGIPIFRLAAFLAETQ